MGHYTSNDHLVRFFNYPSITNCNRPRMRADWSPSLVEMFVGIMCACMPAAAHTYHHHLRSYESLKQNNLHSRYRPSTSKDHSSKPLSPQSKPHAISTSRGVHEGYVSLDALEPAMPTPHAKSLDTFNRTGSHNDLDHDDIILTYELQQSSTSPPPRTGR